ncbi:MAG: MFS transporter, partial [Dehalococcoidia bacterium]
YGFLKNQRYFEPFIILFFLQQGLSFAQIGILVAFREICISLIEVPSGAFADLCGRRKCMILSFSSYIVAFLVFGFSQVYWNFFVAMFFFAVGEAFRTGTHKAIIFTWLRIENRLDEKTKVYGYTRSWSKIGSAVSIIFAVLLVFFTNNYSYVFFLSIIPYLLGLVNFLTYPTELEGQPCAGKINITQLYSHLWESIRASFKVAHLRRLLLESMGFEGVFKAVEDYLQPVIRNAVFLLPLFINLDEIRRNSLMIGVVYLILYLASAYASRKSHKLVEYAKGEESGSRFLWFIALVVYIAMIPLLFFEYYPVAIVAFIALYIIQNFWRPVLISRFDAHATEVSGATVLSIESQAKSLSTMIIAPVLGLTVDYVLAHGLGGEFWPIGIIAAFIALLVIITGKKQILYKSR